MTPEISQALAIYRRQRGRPRSDRHAGPDMAQIEQDAYEAEVKRQQQQAKAQAAEQEAAAKAALKAQNDAAEARYRAEGRSFYTNASGQILASESDEAHASKTRRKAENDAKASEYFQSNRPFRYDAQGNVVPRHTDEEWKALNASKAAKLEADRIDKANKEHRDKVRSGIDQQQAVLSSNDDLVQRRTQELQLAAENARAEVSKRKRFIEDAKKRLDAMDPADTQFEKVSAAMEQMQAELEQHQAAADAADDESRRQQAGSLAWQKEQDVLKGRLRQEEAGVDHLAAPQNQGPATGITTPGTPKVRPDAPSTPGVRERVLAARVDALAKDATLPDEERKAALTRLQLRAKDPAAYETAAKLEMEKADPSTLAATLEKDAAAHAARLAEVEAKAQALTQERDALQQRVAAAFQRAQQRMQAPHTAGDLVTVPGPDGEGRVSMPRDVAEDYLAELARMKQWQDSKQAEADVLEIEGQEANLDARVLNEGQKVLHAKQGQAQIEQMREHEEKLGRMARGGQAGAAAKIKELSADMRARRAVIEEMYPEGGPEHDAAVAALKTESVQREQGIQKEMAGLQRFGAMLYERFKDVSTNFIDRSTTDAEGIEASDTTNQIIDDAAKAKGLDPEDVRRVMETRRVLDWSKPLTGTARRMNDNVLSGLWEKEYGPIEASRLLPDGGVVPNPMLGGDKDAFDKAIAESGASKKAQAEAQKLWPEYQRRFGEAAADALMQEPDFAGSFSDFREQMIREDQAVKGKLGFARKEPWEQALQYLEGRKGRRFDIRALELVRRNVIAGFGDIATQLMGVGAMVTGNEGLSQAAAENAKNMQSLLTGQEFYGPKGLAAGIAGQTARMAPGMAAIIGTGSLAGATVAGGIQTAGSQYADTYGNLRAQNVRHDEAWTRSAAGAYVSGAMTAALTRAFPGGATAILRPGAAAGVRKVLAEGIKNASLAIGKGILDEVPQEVLDEAFSQFTAATVEGRPLRDAVEDFVTGLPELIGASGIMGAGGAVLERFQGGRQTDTLGDKSAPEIPVSPAATGTPQNDISTGPRESELSKPDMGSAVPAETTPAVKAGKSARAPIFHQSEDGILEGIFETAQQRDEWLAANQDRIGNSITVDADGKAYLRFRPKERAAMGKPEMAAAARASIDAFSEEGMKPRQIEDTKAKAGVVLDIAQGAKLADLTDEQLRLVGLNRDGTPGHFKNEPVDKKDPSKGSTRVWKKGPREDGFQPVVIEDGELIITQAQIDNFKRRMPAVAQAIGLSEVERRKQVRAKSEEERAKSFQPQTNEGRIDTQPAPGVGENAAEGGAQEAAAAGDAPARGGQALESPAAEELAPDLETGRQGADEIPMTWEGSSQEAASQNVSSQKSAPAVHPVLASAGFEAPALERAGLIASHLQQAGLSADEAAVAAGSVVKRMGVVGDDYTAQMVEDGFTQAMKAAGFQRRANMPTKWERKPSAERPPMTPATVFTKADAESQGQRAKGAKPRQPLIERADFKAAADKGMLAAFDRLRGSADRGKAQAEIKLLTNARAALVDLVDTQYGAFFDDVVVTPHGNGGGLQARATARDAKTGRATAVVLEIDPETFLQNGSRSREGIERVLNEEFSHRIDLMVSSEREAIDLAKSVHKARPGVFNAAWRQYFSVEIARGELPAKPPAELTDRQAFQLYFEATRLIHQGTFTTENAEMPDIPLMRRLYLYLTRWVQTVQREMRKLPENLRVEWQWRIDQAESMMRKLQKAAIAAEKAALDDVEPPETSQTRRRGDKEKRRGSDPALDADLEAAWEAEEKSRRRTPTFTPAQQALRNLRGLKDPDNDQINILSRISLEGGIAIYSEKVRKMRRQQGLPTGGDLDWLEQAAIPPFWKGLIFRKGNAQNVDKIVGSLFEEGYFPQAAEAGDVTGEMLAAKLADVLARYQALKEGRGDLADADEQYGTEMAAMERQRVEFERSTASGPYKVRPADLKPGDVMQVKGDDGKLHPVEVIRLETRPLASDEEYDPQGNPGHRLGPDGPVVIESVTLKDGTTFGVQTIDGQEGLFVDEFKVKDAYDFYRSLREAVLSGKLDAADGLLHFMQHEGLGPDAQWADILTALQSKLRIPMKKAQKMISAVFDTTPKAGETGELDTDNPLGSARKRDTGPSMFGEDFDLLSGDKGTRGLFEAPSAMARLGDKETQRQGDAPSAAKTPMRRFDVVVPKLPTDSQAKKAVEIAWHGSIQTFSDKELLHALGVVSAVGNSLGRYNPIGHYSQRVQLGVSEKAAARINEELQRRGIEADLEFTPRVDRVQIEEISPSPSPQVSPSSGFTLASVSKAELDAEARRKELREKLQARQDKPLVGTLGDIGQMDMLGGGDLFSMPPSDGSMLHAAVKRRVDRVLPRLAALHNLSAENLAFADRLGGLAVPSIAIVPEGQGMSGFGGITLIGRREMADPGENPVFDADAYTIRFPAAEYGKARSAEAQKLVDRLRPFAEKFDDKSLIYEVWDNAVNRPAPDKSLQKMRSSLASKAAFLKEQGVTVEPAMRAKPLSAEWVTEPAMKKWHSRWSEVLNVGVENEPFMREIGKDIAAAIESYADKRLSDLKDKGSAFLHGLRGVWLKEYLDDKGMPLFGRLMRVGESLRSLGQKVIDTPDTAMRLDEAMEGRESAFATWTERQVLPMMGEPKLTLRGRKVPYTLTNIVEAMTGKRIKAREDTMTFGEGAARAAVSRQFRDLDTLRAAAADSIVPEEQVNEARDKAQKLVSAWRDAVAPYTALTNWRGEKSIWDAMDASMKALTVWAKKGQSPAVLASALRAQRFAGVPQDVIEQGQEAAMAWLHAPVPYFEAKPQRAVQLGEFAGAVIPESEVGTATTEILDRRGIPYQTYPAGSRDVQAVMAAQYAKELAEKGESTLFTATKRGATPPTAPFYSKLAQVIEQKMPNRADATTIKGLITNPQTGIKAEELKWSGILPWLESQSQKETSLVSKAGFSPTKVGNRSSELKPALSVLSEHPHKGGEMPEASGHLISRQEVLDYLANDGLVRLEEVTLGHRPQNLPADVSVNQVDTDHWMVYADDAEPDSGTLVFITRKEIEDFDEDGDPITTTQFVVAPESEPFESNYGRFDTFEEAMNSARSLAVNARDKWVDEKAKAAPKFSRYQLPGGENYREVVLAMPEKKPANLGYVVEQVNKPGALTDGYWRVVDSRGNEVVAPVPNRLWADLAVEKWGEEDGMKQTNYTSSHFPDVPNYVAHLRLNDRVDAEGRPGTFIEEIQSDRHQAGREKGYDGDRRLKPSWQVRPWKAQDDLTNLPGSDYVKPGDFVAFQNGLPMLAMEAPNLEGALSELEALEQENGAFDAASSAFERHQGIPDAPFRTTWPLQMFKRALAEAVAAGKQWIGWTTGDTQAERYDLSKQISAVTLRKMRTGDVELMARGRGDGTGGINRIIKEEELPDYIGKEVAAKFADMEWSDKGGEEFGFDRGAEFKRLSGLDLKVGGEGMKGFYDTILPKEIGKYVKQWGAGVVKGKVGAAKLADWDVEVLDNGTWSLLGGEFMNEAAAVDAGEATGKRYRIVEHFNATTTPIWRVDITPAMRAGVEAGQALFSSQKRGGVGVRAGSPAVSNALDAAAHEAATSPHNDLPEPTEAQREAGNYKLGHVRIAGHDISIENPAGSKRRPEWPELKDHYGYFKGTNAKDGDHVDVFVKPGTPEDYDGPVHVVRQNKVERSAPGNVVPASAGSESAGPPKGGTTNPERSPRFTPTKQFDEYKVMLGYPTAEEARAAYLRNYEPGWPGLHKLTTHPQAEFQRIKDQLFTLPADRLPGVRESDKTLATAAKRAQAGVMADPDKAAHTPEPSPGGLSEAEAEIKSMLPTDVRADYQKFNDRAPILWRGETTFPDVRSVKIIGADASGKSRSIYPSAAITLSNGGVFVKRFRVSDHAQVSETAFRQYDLDYRLTREQNESEKTFDKRILRAAEEDLISAARFAWENQMEQLRPLVDLNYGAALKQQKSQESQKRSAELQRDDTMRFFRDDTMRPAKVYRNKFGWSFQDGVLKDGQGNPLGQFANLDVARFWIRDTYFNLSRAADGTLASAAKRGPVEKVAGAVFSKAPVAVASGLASAGAAAVEKAGLQRVLAKLGSNNFDKFISNVVFGKVAKWEKVQNGKQAVEVWLGKPGLLSKLAKGTLDQTVPLWNVPREWLAAYHESQRKAAWGREKAMDVLRALSHNAKVSDLAYPKEFVEDTAWRVKLFDAMEGKADMTTLPQPLQDLAERLRKLLRETGQELVRQGIMSLDTFEELSATGWMPRYTEDEAEAAGGSWLKAFKLGVKDLVAQRSTAWHVVDTTRKEKDGQHAIVSRDEGGKRNRWRFRNEQHRNAWYEDFLKREAFKVLTGKSEEKDAVNKLLSETSVDAATLRKAMLFGSKDERVPFETMLRQAGADVEQVKATLRDGQGKNAQLVTTMLAALNLQQKRQVRAELEKLAVEDIDKPAKLSPELRHLVRRAVELQRFRYKKEAPFEPDKLIKDPVYAVARYVMGATHNAATMELLKVTAKNAEWVSDVALAGFKQMPDNDRFGPLAGKHVRDEIATQVLDLVDVPGTILGAYDSILRTWKAGKLVLNPGSHIRDAVGNLAFSILAGSNPMNPGNLPYYRDAIAALRDGGAAYAEIIEHQVLGGDAFTTEVKTALKGLLPDTKTVEGKPAGWIMRQIMGVGAGARAGYEWAAEVRQIPDNLYKTAAFLKYKAQGMSAAEAAAEVRKWFPYYDRLGSSALIKQGSRFVMPFSSFFRESTRILGRGAVERPLAMAGILGFASGITQLSLMMLGLGDEDEESVFRSMRGKLKLGLWGDTPVFSMLLPMRSDEGQLQQWDLSSVLPFADLLGTRVEMRQGEDEWTKFWRGLFTQSPILSTAWAWSTNTDAFSGRKIVEDDMGMLESTKERVRELGDTMLPPLTPWFGVHANTLANAGRRMSNLETRNATQSYLRALLGLDVRSADPNLRTETEHWRKEKKLPLANDGSLYATPLKSRLGREIKSELIQDAPNIEAVADAMLRLEESGHPIKTRDDMEKLLKGLDPDHLIKEEYHRKLVQSFSPEALRVWRTQQSEFKAAQRRLPTVMSQVNPLVKARRARVSTPVKP